MAAPTPTTEQDQAAAVDEGWRHDPTLDPRIGKKPVLFRDIYAILKGVARDTGRFTRESIAAATAPLLKRIEELERRPGVLYQGTWTPDKAYPENALVSCSGSMWIAKTANLSRRPGAHPDVWTLCVKAGRDCRPPQEAR